LGPQHTHRANDQFELKYPSIHLTEQEEEEEISLYSSAGIQTETFQRLVCDMNRYTAMAG
jgi:hypothetical protein